MGENQKIDGRNIRVSMGKQRLNLQWSGTDVKRSVEYRNTEREDMRRKFLCIMLMYGKEARNRK